MKSTHVNIRSIKKLHMKLILEYLGIPLAQQPKRIEDMRGLADGFYDQSRDRMIEAYDWVVRRTTGEEDNDDGLRVSQEIRDLAREVVHDAEQSERFAIHEDYKEKYADAIITFHDEMNRVRSETAEAARIAIEKAASQFITIHIKEKGKKSRKIEGIVHEKFERMIQLANRRKNIMLVGPSGCGKTHVAAQIADALGLEYASQSCSAGVSESVFTGWLLPIEKGGSFQYVASKFVDLYENGGVFLIDEMDNGDENVLAFLNQALAQDHFFLAQRFENPLIKKHKDFVVVGAMNTLGTGADAMYVARNALDAATLDRFRLGFIQMDYSEAVESQLINDDVLSWGLAIRKVIEAKGLLKIMSTRVMMDATEMMDYEDWDIDMIEEGYFCDWSIEEQLIVKGALV